MVEGRGMHNSIKASYNVFLCFMELSYIFFVQQDAILKEAVQQNNGKNWRDISLKLEGKSEVQCLHRWSKVLNPDLTKGPWTEEVI